MIQPFVIMIICFIMYVITYKIKYFLNYFINNVEDDIEYRISDIEMKLYCLESKLDKLIIVNNKHTSMLKEYNKIYTRELFNISNDITFIKNNKK